MKTNVRRLYKTCGLKEEPGIPKCVILCENFGNIYSQYSLKCRYIERHSYLDDTDVRYLGTPL